ncbi:uncharacterized protein LOC135392165 [Ornithodoros turicata]|uniref:uncharacterized protein LOC135392165 n=1 Tax=Ornithodoros turicata TaxID=34597 RepID=UPI003138780D
MDWTWRDSDSLIILSCIVSVFTVLATTYYFYRRGAAANHAKHRTADDSEIDEIEEDKLIKEQLLRQEVKRLISAGAAKDAESIISANMTEEQRKQEINAQRQQLEEIFKVMKEHQDKFGDTSLNEVVDQMKLYR